MSEGEKTLFKAEQSALLERQAGGREQAAEMVRQAATALRLAPGAFRDVFFKSGAAQDAWAIRTLANWGAHLERWAESRPAK